MILKILDLDLNQVMIMGLLTYNFNLLEEVLKVLEINMENFVGLLLKYLIVMKDVKDVLHIVIILLLKNVFHVIMEKNIM